MDKGRQGLHCARIWSEYPAALEVSPGGQRQQGPGGKIRANPRASGVIPFRASCIAYAELMLRAFRCEGGASRWPALTVFRGPDAPGEEGICQPLEIAACEG
jgi:hypothetical protein